jgi:hypothetical protein
MFVVSKPRRSAAIALALLFSSLLIAQTTAPVSRPDDLAVTVVSDSGASVEGRIPRLALGAVSFTPRQRTARSKDAFVISKHIHLRITRHDGVAGRAVLQAYLTRDCDRCRITIDGIHLASSPQVVSRVVRLNTVTDHLVEIEVPLSAPAGAIDAEIGWQVEQI